MTRGWVAIFCIVLASCIESHESVDVTAPEGPDFAVRTDSVVYTLHRAPGGYDAVARAKFINRSVNAVYFIRCDPRSTTPMYGLKRIVPDTGFYFVGGAWACVGGVPRGSISPGDSAVINVSLGSTDSPSAQPPVLMSQRTGSFRILLRLCTNAGIDSEDCVSLAENDRSSNTFVLRPPS